MLAHEDHLLRRREDTELAASPELERELAEDLVAESVERADDRIVQPDRRVDVDALLHLGGGAFGERDGKDLVRLRRTRSDEMDDACRKNVGLPRSRPSHNKERARPEFDREPLLHLEPLQDVRTRLA